MILRHLHRRLPDDARVVVLVAHKEVRTTDVTDHGEPLASVEAYTNLPAPRKQHQVSLELIQGFLEILRKRLLVPLVLEAAGVPGNVLERHYGTHGS